MPFGKHKGKPLTELPPGYLNWLLDEADIKSPGLFEALEAERQRREAAKSSQGRQEAAPPRKRGLPEECKDAASELIEMGYRRLALESHPDRGGTNEKMSKINVAIDYLRMAVK